MWINVCRNFCGQIGDSCRYENFIVGSLDYYVLAINFVALDKLKNRVAIILALSYIA